jgi:hypothetical protein
LLASSSQTPPQFSMAGKNRSARYSCLTNKSWALAAKNKIFVECGRSDVGGAWQMKESGAEALVDERKLSRSAHPLQKPQR